MRAASRVLLLALLLPLLACEEPLGGLHVVVSGTPVPGRDFDRLSVLASLPGGAPLALATLEGDSLRLPATFNFESGPSTPAGTRISVRATAERQGTIQSTTSGEATLTEGSGALLELTLPPIPAPPDAGTPLEVCDNGADDDGDGLRDCADPQCDGQGCYPGGLTCSSGACGCTGRTTGAISQRSGFTRRTGPAALVPSVGPYAGALVVAGGRDAEGRVLATVDAYFPSSGRHVRSALAVGRAEAAALSLADGGVVVLGGVREDGQPEQSAEWLDADGGTTRVSFFPALGARGVRAGRLGPDAVLAGGQLSQGTAAPASDAVVKVDLDGSDTGRQTSLGRLSLPCPAGGAMLGDAFALAGGCAGQGASARTDVVEPSGLLGVGPTLPVPLEAPAVVELTGGRVLVAGGRTGLPGGGLSPSARVFLLERTGAVVRVRELSPMDTPRASPRGVRLRNGWVYLEDGAGAAPAWFDPAAERFIPATPLSAPRTGHALVGGAEGQAFVVGGRGPDGGVEDTAVQVELRCP